MVMAGKAAKSVPLRKETSGPRKSKRSLTRTSLMPSFFRKLEFVPFRFPKAVAKLWLIKGAFAEKRQK